MIQTHFPLKIVLSAFVACASAIVATPYGLAAPVASAYGAAYHAPAYGAYAAPAYGAAYHAPLAASAYHAPGYGAYSGFGAAYHAPIAGKIIHIYFQFLNLHLTVCY